MGNPEVIPSPTLSIDTSIKELTQLNFGLSVIPSPTLSIDTFQGDLEEV